MDVRDRGRKLTVAFILIGLGILIFLNETGIYGFSRSWPLLLIVIAVTILVRRSRDMGGWFIGAVGGIFFVANNFDQPMSVVVSYIVSFLLIFAGAYLLADYLRGRGKGSGT